MSLPFLIRIPVLSYLRAPYLRPLLSLINSMKTLSPNAVALGVGLSTHEFGGGHNSVCNRVGVPLEQDPM